MGDAEIVEDLAKAAESSNIPFAELSAESDINAALGDLEPEVKNLDNPGLERSVRLSTKNLKALGGEFKDVFVDAESIQELKGVQEELGPAKGILENSADMPKNNSLVTEELANTAELAEKGSDVATICEDGAELMSSAEKQNQAINDLKNTASEEFKKDPELKSKLLNWMKENPKSVLFFMSAAGIFLYMIITKKSLADTLSSLAKEGGAIVGSALGAVLTGVFNGSGLSSLGMWLLIGGGVILFIVLVVIWFKYIQPYISKRYNAGGSG